MNIVWQISVSRDRNKEEAASAQDEQEAPAAPREGLFNTLHARPLNTGQRLVCCVTLVQGPERSGAMRPRCAWVIRGSSPRHEEAPQTG